MKTRAKAMVVSWRHKPRRRDYELGGTLAPVVIDLTHRLRKESGKF